MDKRLKCDVLLSLKELTLRRVAVSLWSDSDILTSILELRHDRCEIEKSEKEFREVIEPIVKEKVLKLDIPKSVKKQMIEIIRPIGLQIKRWKDLNENYTRDGIQNIILPNSAKLCWTTAGLIDYRKTAEELVGCEVLDVEMRYKLACENCLEDYIPLLWDKLPKEKKFYFFNKVLNEKPPSPCLHYCWPHILEGNLSMLDFLFRTSDGDLATFNRWAFEKSAKSGNKTAAEYFFRKLTHQERETSLVRTVETMLGIESLNEELSNVLCYLFTLITPKQQIKIVQTHAIRVVWCFLNCPWPDLFLENASLFCPLLPRRGRKDLLQKMVHKFKHHYFPKLFQEFFIQSPLDLKKFFVGQKSVLTGFTGHFLNIFFDFDDSESIEVIFRNVDHVDRAYIMIKFSVLNLLCESMLMDRWHLVEVCLREAMLLTRDVRNMVKDAFKYILIVKKIEPENQKFRRFFEFLDRA